MAATNPIQRMSISAQATARSGRAREASAGTRPGNEDFTKWKLARKDKRENRTLKWLDLRALVNFDFLPIRPMLLMSVMVNERN
jgi:hypothetical protein